MKSIIVTGASRGIGKAIALRYAKEKCHLVITCKKNTEMLKEVQNQILSLGSDCITYTGDLSLSSNVNELFNFTAAAYGNVDILINNAGYSHIGLMHNMSDDDWSKIMGNNLDSVFYTCRAALPGMISNKSGCIINISSVWGIHGASCEVAYSASKGAVNAFTKALAKEVAPSGIRVNAIACGYIDTDMNSHLSTEDAESLYEEIPIGRAGTPEEIADAVYNLSLQSPYLTGQIITMDGGWI